MRRRVLCLYLPEWPIQRLRGELKRQNSEFRIQNSKNATPAAYSAFCILHSALPVVLHARDPRRGDVVVACGAAAYERGVRVGMPLAEAAALSEHGGKCLIWPHDAAADLAELARLAEHCERFSPIVGWSTVEGRKSKVESQISSNLRPSTFDFGPKTWPDCLFLDVTGIGVLFGGEEKLGREVVAELKGVGYAARVAITDTVGAAWALSRQQSSSSVQVLNTEYSVRSTEFPATESASGSLPLFTPPTRTSAGAPALRTLPLNSLRLPAATVDLLSQLGIERLEQLLALPRESLKSRFGELLLLRIDQLLGTAQEMIVPHRPPPQFSAEWLLEYPAEQRELVEQILRELVQRIAAALANRREGALKLGCRLDCAPGRPALLEVGLFRPSADQEHLWDLLQMQLEQAALPGPVGRVRLEAVLTAALENRQGELFAGGEHEAQRQFALLIDRCSSRLGTSAVLRPELTADPLPERAVKYRAGVRQVWSAERGMRNGRMSKVQSPKSKVVRARNAERGMRSELSSAFRVPRSALMRPLSLFSPPQALEVLSVAPDGPPVLFRLAGRMHEVVSSAGPERIETGWWRGRSVRRDYWRVETNGGQRFWLFRQLGSGQWFLHGEYA